MNMVERVALILLVAATPLTAQIVVPEEGYKLRFEDSVTDTKAVTPTVLEITYLPKPAEDDIVGGADGDLKDHEGDDPVVYDPVTDTVAVSYQLSWDVPVEVSCYTNVSGKVGGDISNGLGFGTAAANAEAKCAYGGIEVKSGDQASIAITTKDTPMTAGVQVAVFGYQTTVFLDSATAQEVPLADADPGPEKCTKSVVVHFQLNGYASMTLYKPAKGSFYYEAKAGALVRIHGECPFHEPALDTDQLEWALPNPHSAGIELSAGWGQPSVR